MCWLLPWALAAGGLHAVPLLEENTTYYGLVTLDSKAVPYVTGMIRIKVKRRGGYTGKLMIGARSNGFRGKLDETGHDTARLYFRFKRGGAATDDDANYVYDRDADPVLGNVELQMNEAGTRIAGQIEYLDQFGGTLTTIEARAEQKGHSKNPVPGTGNHAFTLVDEESSANSGDGVAKIKSRGRARVAGRLADGRKFTCSSALCDGGVVPTFKFLRKPQGLLLGWLEVSGDPAALGGQFDWNTTGPGDDPPDPADAYRILMVTQAL